MGASFRYDHYDDTKIVDSATSINVEYKTGVSLFEGFIRDKKNNINNHIIPNDVTFIVLKYIISEYNLAIYSSNNDIKLGNIRLINNVETTKFVELPQTFNIDHKMNVPTELYILLMFYAKNIYHSRRKLIHLQINMVLIY